jgi:hypothetical protein
MSKDLKIVIGAVVGILTALAVAFAPMVMP